MTEKEKALFDSLKEKGWFAGEETPALLATFDLSDQAVEPPASVKQKKRKKKAPARTAAGLALCQGVALIHKSRVCLWQDGIKTGEVALPEGERLTCEIAEGVAFILCGNTLLFRSRDYASEDL